MTAPDTDLKEKLEEIKKKIEDAAKRSGRKSQDILLLGVTKTVEIDTIQKIYDLGMQDFGENRVQEYLRKADTIGRTCYWHLIGRIQTNKVKYLDARVTLIHSLDRMELAQALDERAKRLGIVWNVLIQVNVSGESTKAGIEPAKLSEFINQVSKLGNIRVSGLMTIAPYAENPGEIRWVFRELKKLAVDIQGERVENISMEVLSMGMSHDYEVAVEEGSTIVRIGSAIFGERVY